MIALLDLTHVVNRLKAQCPLLENRVYETVAGNDAALEFYGAPAAFVFLAADQSQDNQKIKGVLQPHGNGIAVRLSVRKAITQADKLSGADAQTIRLCRQQILTALLGWKIPGAATPMEHSTGELTDRERYLTWDDTFNTTDYLSNL